MHKTWFSFRSSLNQIQVKSQAKAQILSLQLYFFFSLAHKTKTSFCVANRTHLSNSLTWTEVIFMFTLVFSLIFFIGFVSIILSAASNFFLLIDLRSLWLRSRSVQIWSRLLVRRSFRSRGGMNTWHAVPASLVLCCITASCSAPAPVSHLPVICTAICSSNQPII